MKEGWAAYMILSLEPFLAPCSSPYFIFRIHPLSPALFFEWVECWVNHVTGLTLPLQYVLFAFVFELCIESSLRRCRRFITKSVRDRGTQVVSGIKAGCGGHADINFKWKTADNRAIRGSLFRFIQLFAGYVRWAGNSLVASSSGNQHPWMLEFIA